jgi:sugar lactone lactonase YvrE
MRMATQRIRPLLGAALFVQAAAALPALAADRHEIAEICGDCKLEKFATCGGFLEGATFDRSGTLWVVDLMSGNVIRIDDGGTCHVEASTGGAPNGAKFHRDGRLFIADKNLGVIAYDPATKKFATIADTYRAERIRGTNDLVFDANGGLYFTEPYGSSTLDPDGRVFYLPPGPNAELVVVADRVAFPNGIALTANGANVFVGEFASKRVLSLPAVGSTNAFDIAHVHVNTEGGTGPDGFGFDADGNLYTAIFQGGEIRVFDPAGFAYGSIVLPEGAGPSVTNLAFKDNRLYITEAAQGVVWRVQVEHRGLPFFHER